MHNAAVPMSVLQHSGSLAARPRQFRLRSLLLVITWIAIVLGVWRASPLVGVLAAAFSVPAMLRTARFATRCEVRGHSLSAGKLVKIFLRSFSTMLVLAVTSVLLVLVGMTAGALAGLSTAATLCRCVGGRVGPVHSAVGRCSWPVVYGTLGLLSATVQCVRKHRGRLVLWPAIAIVLLASVAAAGTSLLLGAAMCFCSGARLAGNHLTGVCGVLRWLFQKASTSTMYLAGIEAQLLRELRAPGGYQETSSSLASRSAC